MAIASKVQSIVSADIAGNDLPPATAEWLTSIGDSLHERLAEHGLCSPRDHSTLSDYLEKFLRSHKGEVGHYRMKCLETAKNKLNEYFGEDKPLRQITADDAKAFRLWLVGQGYAEATVASYIKRSKMFFRAAVKAKAVAENPFDDIAIGSEVNDDRSQYIDTATIYKAIGMAPDAQWRLIITLCRFAGLRCPSEVLALRWADVDFEKGSLTIREGKTKKRLMPILPELRPYLEDAFDPENIRVISRYRESNFNLRKVFLEILEKAELEPWPRLFHNLRGSLETDLANRFPLHVVTRWLGNSVRVANEAYLKITPEHFAQAVAGVGQGVGTSLAETADIERNDSQPICENVEENEKAHAYASAEYPRQDSNL